MELYFSLRQSKLKKTLNLQCYLNEMFHGMGTCTTPAAAEDSLCTATAINHMKVFTTVLRVRSGSGTSCLVANSDPMPITRKAIPSSGLLI